LASNAKETQKQENGSRFVFENFIENGKMPSINEIEKAVYPDMPAKWYTTYELQAKALKNYLKTEKGYNYSRDIGIMPFIEKLASRNMGVTTKDRWNPMDIVIVKRNFEKDIRDKITSISNEKIDKQARLVKLNSYMKELLIEKKLIGISLKEIKKGVDKAIVEESNISSSKSAHNFKLKRNSLKCRLDMDRKGLFDTGELAMDFIVDNESEIHVQARSFRYSIPNTVVQTDLTPKGRQSGAKLGKASTQALDQFLKGMKLQRPESPTNHKMIDVKGEFTETQLKYWDNLYNKIKNISIGGSKIDFGNNRERLSILIQRACDNKKSPNVLGRLTSKLVALEWAYIYCEISKAHKFEQWLSCLYYGAKKEFSDTNGPFIKIY